MMGSLRLLIADIGGKETVRYGSLPATTTTTTTATSTTSEEDETTTSGVAPETASLLFLSGEGAQKEEETQATHQILEDVHAKFSPQCVFESESWGTGTATITNEILNLVKNIVGSGGLSLPAGIAAFGNHPTAILPAICVIGVMGILNAYSFSLLGRVCSVTKSKTYQDAWDRTVGRRFSEKYNVVWVGLVVTGKAILGCWSFSIVIASTCQPLLKILVPVLLGGSPHYNYLATTMSKSEVLLGITILLLLPLCLLEKLSSLAFFSIIGQLGTLVTTLTMVLRYFDGTYRPGGKFYADVLPEHLPSFGNKGALSFFSPQALILVSILSTGYIAHYNAPKFYFELKDHTTGKFNIVVNASFILAAITYMCISSLGFLTFGANSAGFILDNYSYRDPLATLSRFGVALSVIFAYPLLFQGGRDGLWDLLGLSSTSNNNALARRITTILLLATVTWLAIFVNDLTFVLSFGGATLSSAIIYIFPPLMFQSLVLNCTCVRTYRTNWEVKESQIMMWVGGLLGVCGAVVTVIRTFF